MSYSENPIIENIVLTIINDGDGSQCGMSYDARLARAHVGIYRFRDACRQCSRYLHENFDLRQANPREIRYAAIIVQDYYRNHAEEIARHG